MLIIQEFLFDLEVLRINLAYIEFMSSINLKKDLLLY